jgi:peptidoglycan glycosyltransferase
MALTAATIANDGQMPRPTLLLNQPGGTKTVVSLETAQWVSQAMALAVAEGPAGLAAVPNATVAGKVGTAETGGDALPHAWFVGFAPAGPGESPRFAVAVVVEHGGEGSQVAAPIAARLLKLAMALP